MVITPKLLDKIFIYLSLYPLSFQLGRIVGFLLGSTCVGSRGCPPTEGFESRLVIEEGCLQCVGAPVQMSCSMHGPRRFCIEAVVQSAQSYNSDILR